MKVTINLTLLRSHKIVVDLDQDVMKIKIAKLISSDDKIIKSRRLFRLSHGIGLMTSPYKYLIEILKFNLKLEFLNLKSVMFYGLFFLPKSVYL